MRLVGAISLAGLAACGAPAASSPDAATPVDAALPSCPNDLPQACTAAPSWSTTIVPIVTQRCDGCHAPGLTASTVPLDTYEQVHSRRGAVLNQIFSCQMPPPLGGVPLTDDERALLLEWLVCGGPNN